MKGAKEEITPERSRGTAYRGTTDSTKDSIPQDSGNCKQKNGTYRCIPAWYVPFLLLCYFTNLHTRSV